MLNVGKKGAKMRILSNHFDNGATLDFFNMAYLVQNSIIWL